MDLIAGSVEPAVALTLTDGGEPMNLSTATLVQLRAEQHGEELFLRSVATPYAADGKLKPVPWQAGDTDVPGRIWLDVAVTWPGGRVQWVRPADVVDVLPL